MCKPALPPVPTKIRPSEPGGCRRCRLSTSKIQSAEQNTRQSVRFEGRKYRAALPDRKPCNRLFAKAVDYRTYPLNNKGRGRFDAREVDKLSDIRKQVQTVMTTDKFAGRNPILFLHFLCAIRHACDDCAISEPTALRVLKHFLVGNQQAVFLVYLGAGIEGSQRGVD